MNENTPNLQAQLGLSDEAIKFLLLAAIDSGYASDEYNDGSEEAEETNNMLDSIFDAHATITAEENADGHNFI